MKPIVNLKTASIQFLNGLLNILFTAGNKQQCKMKTSLEPIPSELEIKMQWDEFTSALEKNSAYLEALKNLEAEPFLELGFKPNGDYLASVILSHQIMRSLIRDYTYPSGYVLN